MFKSEYKIVDEGSGNKTTIYNVCFKLKTRKNIVVPLQMSLTWMARIVF